MPQALGGYDPLRSFLAQVFGPQAGAAGPRNLLLALSALASLVGLGAGWLLFLRLRSLSPAIASSAAYRAARLFLFAGWGFDWIYDRLLVRPYIFLARINRADAVDFFFTGLALGVGAGGRLMSATQSGRVRNYAAALLLGAVVVVAILLVR